MARVNARPPAAALAIAGRHDEKTISDNGGGRCRQNKRKKVITMTARLNYNRITGKIMFDNMPLEDGQRLKVLIVNGLNNQTEWMDTQLLMSEEGIWFLDGLWGYEPIGLFAEIQGEPQIRVTTLERK